MRTLFTVFAILAANLFSTASATADDYVYAEIKTNMGLIVLELNKTKAPITVANFEDYAKSGYYNGTVFHRVISNFMIQGGGFDFHGKYPAGLHQKPGTKAPIKNEGNNGLKNTRGTIAMARTNDPNSATSQFFINVNDNAFLNQGHDPKGNSISDAPGYAVFGKVIAGMDTVDRIKAVPTATINRMQNVPAKEVMIESVSIVTKDQALNAESTIAAEQVKNLEAQIAELQAQLAEAKKKAEQLGSKKE